MCAIAIFSLFASSPETLLTQLFLLDVASSHLSALQIRVLSEVSQVTFKDGVHRLTLFLLNKTLPQLCTCENKGGGGGD